MGGQKDGDQDFQIFNRGPRLGALIRYIQAQRPNDDVALVLNGDIIDSLAEDEVPGFVALDARTAVRMMDRIYADPSFSPVWEALSGLVSQARRHLVFVVGNHDIELSLPIVEDSIRRRLAEGNADAQARIHFATHGGGFACAIGATRVFCTHGNELDPMNWVDYNLLGQLANAINARRVVEPAHWKPNAGTRFVINVMNDVKRQFPFVDLLKPEVAAIVSVLIALDRDVVKKIDLQEDFPIIRDAIRGALVKRKLLGPEEASIAAAPPEALAEEAIVQLLGQGYGAAVRGARGSGRTEDDLLLDAGRAVAQGKRASEVLGAGEAPETLGAWDLFRGWLGLVSKLEGLRLALKDWIKDSTTYKVDEPDSLSREMADRAGDGVGFVVTGHTHLARALELTGSRYYYNCGTWIRLLRLTDEVLADNTAFEKSLWPALTAGRMSMLDAVQIPGPGGGQVPLLFDRTNVVRISADGDRVGGDLMRVSDGTNGEAVLQLEPGARSFTVG
jgi:UDP-2,3-diacylglucosamine pyrophosphatase LpxH